MAPKPRRPPRGGGNREAKRWDDPDDDSGEDDEEAYHPQTDQGLKEDDEASEDCMVGSDSDGEGKKDDGIQAELDSLTARRAAQEQLRAAKAKREEDDGLWDPLAGLAPRKKRRAGGPAEPAKGTPAGAAQAGTAKDFPSMTSTFGFAEGTAVCLVDLQKAPQLNGTVGFVGAAMDRATGRSQIILRDGTVKSLRLENLKEVFTGGIVRLHGLQGAAELNGRIAEAGDLDLKTGRYSVTLADGKETVKKVKAENLEFVKRYVNRTLMLSAQRAPFTWSDACRQCSNSQRPWKDQLAALKDAGVPAPLLVSGAALVASGGDDVEPISADKAPVDEEGRIACRIFAVSFERDALIPKTGPDLKRLKVLSEALMKHDPAKPPYFVLPHRCVKALPCLRDAAACAWPMYVQLSQALLCMDSPYRIHKAWCRMESLMAGALTKPVYQLPAQGEVVVSARSWLLSDRSEEVQVGAPTDGQLLPAERPLFDKMAAALLPGGAGKPAQLTSYRF